jgi:hypothetical protein
MTSSRKASLNILTIRGRIGERHLDGCLRPYCGWRRGARVPSPDQDAAILIQSHALAVNQLVLEIVERRVIELKLPLEGAVGQAPPALEHGDRVVKDLLKGHG